MLIEVDAWPLMRSLVFLICRLSVLHEVLADMADSPRIVQCAQTTPILLQVFFNEAAQVAVFRVHMQYSFSFNT